jgi:hypothetical protein
VTDAALVLFVFAVVASLTSVVLSLTVLALIHRKSRR